jgi:hypothetical protein
MKGCGGVDVQIYIFLTSTLFGGEWPASRSGRFTPGERAPGTYWTVGWVSLRAGLDDMQRKFLTLLGLELRPLGRPARSQSLYRLRYPGSYLGARIKNIWDRIITFYFECAKYELKVRR